jgi:hypothetical protein
MPEGKDWGNSKEGAKEKLTDHRGLPLIHVHPGDTRGWFVCLFYAVLGLELRAYTLSHSTSPFL